MERVRGWLVVFAKAPIPGFVKTRLCPPLSPGEAAEFYRCLLADALDESARAAHELGLEPVLTVDPPDLVVEFARQAPPGFRVIQQRGRDLPQRMSHVAQQAAAAGAPLALLRGSDSPTLATPEIREAHASLETHDVVLRPDRDGGYTLVGLSARALLQGTGRWGLFDHAMSTSSVLLDTNARADRLGLARRSLRPGFDIDRFDDLRWLEEERTSGAIAPCPRTLAYLDSRGLWPSHTARQSGTS